MINRKIFCKSGPRLRLRALYVSFTGAVDHRSRLTAAVSSTLTHDFDPQTRHAIKNKPTGMQHLQTIWLKSRPGHTDTRQTRAYSKRVFRTNCALRIKKCDPGIPVAFIF